MIIQHNKYSDAGSCVYFFSSYKGVKVSEGIIISIITSVFALLGVIITALYGNRATKKNIKEQTDLTIYRIEQLEKKQDKHNKLVERMYNVEEKVGLLEEKIKVENHRIGDLEEFHKPN